MQFLKNEDGAVTVDWVVLSAAVVGLGIAAATTVQNGMSGASGTLTSNVSYNVCIESMPVSITDCFTGTATTNAVGGDLAITNMGQQIAFGVDIDLSAGDGIIFERGANRGFLVYQDGNELVMQVTTANDTNEYKTVKYQIPAGMTGPQRVEGTFATTENGQGSFELFVNGRSVGKETFVGNDKLADGGSSSIGDNLGKTNTILNNDAGFTTDDGNGHPGFTQVDFFNRASL